MVGWRGGILWIDNFAYKSIGSGLREAAMLILEREAGDIRRQQRDDRTAPRTLLCV
jgi:hypothetical protein